jgi:hypothetical protein
MYEDFADHMPGLRAEPTMPARIEAWKAKFGKRLPGGRW